MRFDAPVHAIAVSLCLAVLGHSQSRQEERASLRPYPGFAGVIEAFQRATIVALPDRHQDGMSSRFRIELVSQPQFADTVNDIVIEWGNRLYQRTLDRYIAGDDTPDSDLRKIWRNTTVINGTWDSPVYREFLTAVRLANSQRPNGRRMRVVAGDPPIDWDTVHNRRDFQQFAEHRDDGVLSVIETDVLANHHKGLLIMGGGHFRRGVAVDGRTGVIDLFERAHAPERAFVIGVTPSLNQQLGAYPPASFFFTRGSWLEAISSTRDTTIYDGVLTLPDGDRMPADPSTYEDAAYSRELDRRTRIVRGEDVVRRDVLGGRR